MNQEKLLDLIARSKAGDHSAQEQLVVAVQNKVYYHCKKFLKNEDDAQDATQNVLITMLTSLEKLREPAAFWGWVNSITANRCKNLLTREPKEWQIPEDEEGNSMLDSIETLDDQTIPDQVLDNEETRRLVMEIIDGLPAEQRMTVVFFYYDEMSVKDIAGMMEVSEGTVKSRLNYARKLVMTFYYSDDRRELPFEETERLIDNQQSILSMLNGQYDPDNVPIDMLSSLIGSDEEENPDFFP